MTKTDLVNYVAEEAGLSKADATRAIDAVMSGITKGVTQELVNLLPLQHVMQLLLKLVLN